MDNITELINKWKYLRENVGNINIDLDRAIQEIEQAAPFHNKKIIGHEAVLYASSSYGNTWSYGPGQINIANDDFNSVSSGLYLSDSQRDFYPTVKVRGFLYGIMTYQELVWCCIKAGIDIPPKPTVIPLFQYKATLEKWATFYGYKLNIIKEGGWVNQKEDYCVAEFA